MGWISFLCNFVAVENGKKRVMKRYSGMSFILISAMLVVGATSGPETTVKWMTFERAVEKSKVEKRKIFIDVYTDWCGWCKVMDKNTFSEPKIAKLLNEEFYPVKFDAEQRENVVFSGTTFKFVPSGNKGYHELAAALLNNKMSYPSVVFLDEEFRMIQPLAGYQRPEEFHKVIQFIGEDHYKTISWAAWQGKYKSPY
jgi:thioredoxin-related protein